MWNRMMRLWLVGTALAIGGADGLADDHDTPDPGEVSAERSAGRLEEAAPGLADLLPPYGINT